MPARNMVAVLLALLTGLALGHLLTPALVVPPPSSARHRSTERAAMAFYEAVNHYLEGGDAAVLEDVLDAGFVDHTNAGPDRDAGGLLRYLRATRAAYPDLRFEVAAMTPREDMVAVAVATTAAPAVIAPGLVPDRLPSIAGYEQLRIVDGKIAERWASGALPPQYEAFATLDLRHLSGWFIEMRSEPLLVAPDTWEIRRQFSPSLLIVESGPVVLDIDPRDASQSPLLQSGDPTTATPIRRGARIELEAEQVVVFPDGESYRLSNTGQRPVSVIIVAIDYRPSSFFFANGQNIWIDPTSDDPEHLPPGTLPMGTDPDRTHTFSLLKMEAAPNEIVPIHSVAGLEQLIVADGSLDIELQRGDAEIVALDQRISATPGERWRLVAGERITASANAYLSYHVTGDGSGYGLGSHTHSHDDQRVSASASARLVRRSIEHHAPAVGTDSMPRGAGMVARHGDLRTVFIEKDQGLWGQPRLLGFPGRRPRRHSPRD